MNHDDIREIARLIKSELAPEWLTESQVCERLQVSDNYVRDNRSKLGGRLLPCARGRAWRYRRDAVDAALINPF